MVVGLFLGFFLGILIAFFYLLDKAALDDGQGSKAYSVVLKGSTGNLWTIYVDTDSFIQAAVIFEDCGIKIPSDGVHMTTHFKHVDDDEFENLKEGMSNSKKVN